MPRKIELFIKDHGQAFDFFLGRFFWILFVGLLCFALGSWWEGSFQSEWHSNTGNLPDILDGVESLPNGINPDLRSDLVGWIQSEMEFREKKRRAPIWELPAPLCVIAAMTLLLVCGGLEHERSRQRATEAHANFLLDREVNHLKRAMNPPPGYTNEDARMEEILSWSNRSSYSSNTATKLEALRVLLCEIARRNALPKSERLTLADKADKAIRSGELIGKHIDLLQGTLRDSPPVASRESFSRLH